MGKILNIVQKFHIPYGPQRSGVSPYELMTGRVMKLPIDPYIFPADLGPLTVAKQQTVLMQLQECIKVLYAQAALKQIIN